MSESAIKGNAIFGTIDAVEQIQSDLLLQERRQSLSGDSAWRLDRLFDVTKSIKARLSQTPTTLISLVSLNALAAGLSAAYTEAGNFRENGNEGHLAHLNAQIDQNVIPHLVAFGTFPLESTADSLASIVGAVRANAEATIGALKATAASVTSELTTLSQSIANQQDRIEQLTQAVANQKNEALAVTAQVQAAYATVEQDLIDRSRTQMDSMSAQFTELANTTQEVAKGKLASLGRLESEAKQIVQVVGNIGVTGNYQKIADSEVSVRRAPL